jgi:hypothetical protein
MTKRESPCKLPREPDLKAQPQINTYDSGYEHSVEHWYEVRRLFAKEEDEVQQGLFARLLK